MRMIRNIKNRNGFSIAELLVAILILSMVSTVVAGGIPVARDAYNNITVAANAEVLLSTAIYSLRGELWNAQEINVPDTNTKIESDPNTIIEFRNRKNGFKTEIFVSDPDSDGNKKIMIQEYIPEDSMDAATKPKPRERELIPGISKDNLYASYSRIYYEEGEGVVTIEGLTVKKKGEPCGVKEIKLVIKVL